MAPLTVEIWSDIVCPWCYVGKRRLEAALARFERPVEVTWRSFELDPSAPRERDLPAAEHLAAKYGMSVEQAQASQAQLTELAAAEGLEYHLDRTRGGNSFDAHRMLHLAAAHDLQDAAKERLMRAYFTEAEPIGDPDTLVRLMAEIGIDEDEARAVLRGRRVRRRRPRRRGSSPTGSASRACRSSSSTAATACPAPSPAEVLLEALTRTEEAA